MWGNNWKIIEVIKQVFKGKVVKEVIGRCHLRRELEQEKSVTGVDQDERVKESTNKRGKYLNKVEFKKCIRSRNGR